jgi:hypothetical protein
MTDLSIQRKFMEKWMAAVAEQAADAAASPQTRPLDPDTGDGDTRQILGTLIERSHQMQRNQDQTRGMLVLLQQGMTTLLMSQSSDQSTDTSMSLRQDRMENEAKESGVRINNLEGWRYGIKLSIAAVITAVGAISGLATFAVEYLQHRGH